LGYLRTALTFCRLTETSPSFILHPLDLVGGEQIPDLDFFPAMDRSSARKRDLFRRVMAIYKDNFSLVPMSVHARALVTRIPLDLRQPGPLRLPASELERESQCAAS
jgi:hypothetical protein